jgi:hypothetical protein
VIKAEILPKAERIDVKHIRKHARTKSMAVVMLGNVTMGKKAIGNLTGEFEDKITWEGIELPTSIKSKFRTARYEDGFFDAETKVKVTRAQALVAVGNTFYYLP